MKHLLSVQAKGDEFALAVVVNTASGVLGDQFRELQAELRQKDERGLLLYGCLLMTSMMERLEPPTVYWSKALALCRVFEIRVGADHDVDTPFIYLNDYLVGEDYPEAVDFYRNGPAGCRAFVGLRALPLPKARSRPLVDPCTMETMPDPWRGRRQRSGMPI